MKKKINFKKTVKWICSILLLSIIPLTCILQVAISCSYKDNSIATPIIQDTNIPFANTLSLETAKNFKSSSELLNSLDDYKKLKNKIVNEVEKSDFDFTSSTNWTNDADKFLDLIKDYGIVNNIGSTPEKRLELSTRMDEKNLQKFTTKRMLNNFSDSDTNGAIDCTDKIDLTKFNDLIKDNPFGFLPSNLSEFLFFIKIDDLSSLFNIKNSIKEILANFNDEKGEIKIFIVDENDEKFIFNFNVQNLNNLKKNSDYFQYVYDRSFKIRFPIYKYKNVAPPFSPTRKYEFSKPYQDGTAWIVDRINNNDGKYEFLIATNVHVLSLSETYNKYYYENPDTTSTYFNENWNAGFWSKDYQDNIEVINDKYGNTYERLNKAPRTKPIPVSIAKSTNELVDGANNNNWKIENLIDSLSSENYIDIVMYTPLFDSSAIRTLSVPDGYFYDDNDSKLVKNSGMDFGLSKISLTKDQIKDFFPSLYKVLDTSDEKNWYIGLNSNLILPSQTIFCAGYDDSSTWINAKFDSGRIYAKNRQLDLQNGVDVIRYWTRYNEQINKQRNKNTYTYYEKQFRPELEHGMDLWFANNQNSFYLGKPDNVLKPGCSGSLAINSRFEPIGVLNLVYFNNGNIETSSNFANGITLFNSIIDNADTTWNGNVITDVLSFLRSKDIKTFKINN